LTEIFDPFRRGARKGEARAQGLGLGLFITEQIVLAHGGKIEVRSTPAEGTAFVVTLPS
jgi:signal transduction histidine kinase